MKVGLSYALVWVEIGAIMRDDLRKYKHETIVNNIVIMAKATSRCQTYCCNGSCNLAIIGDGSLANSSAMSFPMILLLLLLILLLIPLLSFKQGVTVVVVEAGVALDRGSEVVVVDVVDVGVVVVVDVGVVVVVEVGSVVVVDAGEFVDVDAGVVEVVVVDVGVVVVVDFGVAVVVGIG